MKTQYKQGSPICIYRLGDDMQKDFQLNSFKVLLIYNREAWESSI